MNNSSLSRMLEPPVFNTENNIIPEDFQLFISSPSGVYICILENISDAVSYSILIIKE